MPQPRKTAPSARKTNTSSGSSPGRSRPPRLRAGIDEESVRYNLVALRELLSRGVVITGDRIQETMDEAVRRGRMTRDDAEDLVQTIIDTGRAQTRDVLAELETLLGSAGETRKQTQARVKSVARAARKAPGTDQALRHADRVRRAAGLGPSFPITGYDDLTAAQIVARFEDLTAPELRKVRDHERRNANRKSVLGAIEKKLA